MMLGLQCGLRVEHYDGSIELFRFGFTTWSIRGWALAIMEFCDALEDNDV